MKRTSILAMVSLVAVLVVGFSIGYEFGRRASMKRPGRDIYQMTLLGAPRSLLVDSLNLSAAQRQTVGRILDDASTHAQHSIDAMVKDVRNTTQQAREQVRAALNDGQRARLDSILATVSEMKPRTPMPPREMIHR